MMWTVSGWNWVWMTLSMVLFWGAIVGVIAWVVRRPESRSEGLPPASRILEERFARGEISAEELEEGRRVLESGNTGAPGG